MFNNPNDARDDSVYGWKIYRDHLDGAEVAIYGPRNITAKQRALLDGRAWPGAGDPVPVAFRIYDDDGELYYSGRYVGPDDEWMFGPLDDFGRPNAGATEIRYRDRETGRWETL